MRSPYQGNLFYFHSSVDGQLTPCAVAETGSVDGPRPLIVEVSPGAMGDLQRCVGQAEELARVADELDEPCVILRATGRGSGSVYQNYGEVDVFEAIAHVRSLFDIDADRILVTGGSMGGAATWYLSSHYPDVFAGGAPFCGYCDYTKWEKPGGMTFHMNPWEEPSWQARSASTLLDNFEHTPMHIVHGEWDRSIGGGVPVAHSIAMSEGLAARGFTHEYVSVPKCGHGCRNPNTLRAAMAWMLTQRKTQDPDHVRHVTPWLRHGSAYWVSVEALARYGESGTVDARREDGKVTVTTDGVAALALGPTDSGGQFQLGVDGADLGRIDLGETTRLARDEAGAWALAAGPEGAKRPGVSGPISDLFFDGTLLVPGTTGSGEETFFNDWVASHAVGYFRSRNGGVHRGGITGDNVVQLPLIPDAELSDEPRGNHNLMLYGTPRTNGVFARFAEALPVQVGDGELSLGGRTWSAPGVAAIAIFPHPENPERYVAVHTGTTPDAITWGSHLDMQLLPDYLVYAGGELLDWGFFDGSWRVPG